MNLVANTTLCAGALPVMAHAADEVEEMVAHASALAINMGTLDPPWIEAMLKAGKEANRLGVPVVLDPVGAGATSFRTKMARKLLSEIEVSAVCGNAGEIATIAGLEAEVRGVESLGGDARTAVMEAAKAIGATVAATGPTDFVSDGKKVLAVENGHPLMGGIVGSGCASTAIIACFAAASDASLETVSDALAFFGCAGEDAAPNASGPGTFEPRLLDAVAALASEPNRFEGRPRISEVSVG